MLSVPNGDLPSKTHILHLLGIDLGFDPSVDTKKDFENKLNDMVIGSSAEHRTVKTDNFLCAEGVHLTLFCKTEGN